MAEQRIIYDIGAHDGADIGYYLMKADKVVAVEAIPALADTIRAGFSDAIASGRLVVVNCAISERDGGAPIDFHVHRTNPVLSTIVAPQRNSGEYDRIPVPARTASSLIKDHGEPWYVKIDVEHFDGMVLKDLFDAGIRPPLISAECHDVSVFAKLMDSGGYNAFKLVSGGDIRRRFGSLTVETRTGTAMHHFTGHSSGPFGVDIPGPWLSANALAHQLVYEQFGHIDVHATNDPEMIGTPSTRIDRMSFRQWIRMLRLNWYRKKFGRRRV